MSIPVIDKIKPLGNFAVADASDIDFGDNKRLPEALENITAEIPTKTSELINDSGFITEHQSLANYVQTNDIRLTNSRPASDVKAWAKADNKPTYTASEVGALPASTIIPTIPTNVSAFLNDVGYYTKPTLGIPKTDLAASIQESLSKADTALQRTSYATPEMYGAVGDGVADDTVAIQTAINNNTNIVFTSENYKITDTIVVPSQRRIDFMSSKIVANCGTAKPLFRVGNSATASENISFAASGSIISGTASAAFYFEGTDDFSISPRNYSRCIRMDGVHVSDANFETSLYFKTAVRQLFIQNCFFYSKNGVIADGKIVETMFDNNIIYCTSSENTHSFKITSDLGGNKYSEGWTISNCTIDVGEIYVSDIFVLEMTNNYIGSKITLAKPKTTTHTEEILISGNILHRGGIKFNSPSGSFSFNSVVNGNVFVYSSCNFSQGIYNVTVSNCAFYGGTDWGIIIGVNSSYISCTNLRFSETYAGGVIVQGATGTGIYVTDINYKGTGDAVYISRPVYLSSIIPPKNLMNKYTDIVSKTYSADEALANTLTSYMATGERGYINGYISVSNVPDGTTLQITLSDGIDVPHGVTQSTGSGWSAQYIEVRNGNASFQIPYVCTKDVIAQIGIKNTSTGSISVGYHSWISITKNN